MLIAGRLCVSLLAVKRPNRRRHLLLVLATGLIAGCRSSGPAPQDAGSDAGTDGGTAVKNGLIAFTTAGAGTPTQQVFTIDATGAGRRQLTDAGNNTFPAWSPDGHSIVFCSDRTGRFELYTMNADGTGQTLVPVAINGDKGVPRFSPDGTQFAFVIVEPSVGHPEIWTASTTGANPIRLTLTPTADAGPTWSLLPSFSPDGRRIAYGSTRSGSSEIWVMSTDGSAQTQLTRGLGPTFPDANAPDWSPDGTQIAFWSGFETQYGEIWTMRADGGTPQRLTSERAPVSSDNPVWSPDQAQILFDTKRSGAAEIWVMGADGAAPRKLIAIGLGNTRFSWQPLRD